MKVWMRLLALMMALLLGTAALAENMTLTEKIAAAEEEVLQWYEMDGNVTEEDARAAVEYLLDRGAALFENSGALTDEEAVRVAEAVTYLEQACANVAIGVSSPVVRLCSAMRTCVEQLYKQGLAWEESGVASYAVAFESAREELTADLDGNVASLCDRAASLKARLEEVEAETRQWLQQQGEVAQEELENAIAYLREHASELEKGIEDVSEDVAAELTRALVYVETAVDQGMDEAGKALEDMDAVKAAYEAARAEVEADWENVVDAIGELFS